MQVVRLLLDQPSVLPECLGETAAARLPPVAAPLVTPPVSAPSPANPATTPVLTPPDLEAFFDGILPLQLERSDIAGASVLVMKDGNVILQKGYGYADAKSKKPVDPAATIFLGVDLQAVYLGLGVQLVEHGKLDLDTHRSLS
jgi:CubicO group peptidase (beta-lactamase class C family)